MRVRLYRPRDASALSTIFHDAVHQIGRRDYSAEQLAAWSAAPVPAEKFDARVSDGRTVFVAVDHADRPLGFIELEDNGHIDCFYCSPDYAGTGVGDALYRTLEDAATARGLRGLHVEASEAARRFFLKHAFSDDGRRDFVHNGTAIHNYAMSKRLDPAS